MNRDKIAFATLIACVISLGTFGIVFFAKDDAKNAKLIVK